MASAGKWHTVLRRSDGEAVACGLNSAGQCSIPPLDEGISYCQVSGGDKHTVLLRSDGQAVACGYNEDGRCSMPPLNEGNSYTQVSAGAFHTILLRSGGQAVACGSNSYGQCNIPPLDEGISYCQVSAGGNHTVLLRSDGRAIKFGGEIFGTSHIPPLDEGILYSQVSAGGLHTVLLRSDGQAVSCGWNHYGQLNMPSLKSWSEWFGFPSPGYRYICDDFRTRVVQVDLHLEGDSIILTCAGLDGQEVLRLKTRKSDRAVDVCRSVACELNTSVPSLRMVLPDGHLLSSIWKANPFAKLSDVISGVKHREWAKNGFHASKACGVVGVLLGFNSKGGEK